MTDNMIRELVPRIFQQLKNLKYLDLSGNSIGSISADVFRDIPVNEKRESKIFV